MLIVDFGTRNSGKNLDSAIRIQQSEIMLISFQYVLFDHSGNMASANLHSHLVRNFHSHFVILDPGNSAVDSSAGQNIISHLEICQQVLMFFFLLLLRSNEQKIKDDKDQNNR